MKFILLVLAALASSAAFGANEAEPPRAFSLCAGCHTTMADGQDRKAPPLRGIIGRKIASMPNFDYSDTLKSEDGIWTKDRLDSFLQRPNHALPGTKMYFRGLANSETRALLIDWLASADVPAVVPPRETRRQPDKIDRIQRANDLFRPCLACHTYTQGAPAKIGPNLFGVVGRPVASFPGFDYSERLKRRGGVWDDANLHGFFAEQKEFDQGSHMAFRTLTRTADRELLIDFLSKLSP